MPAEWEPHEATWLSWPKDPETFPDQVLHKVEQIYIEMISALHEKEKVHLLVNDERTGARVQKMLDDAGINGNVFMHKIKTIDVWIRDYGPIFISNSCVLFKYCINDGSKFRPAALLEETPCFSNVLGLLSSFCRCLDEIFCATRRYFAFKKK